MRYTRRNIVFRDVFFFVPKLSFLFLLSAAVLLSACAGSPQNSSGSTGDEPVPELTLNLTDQSRGPCIGQPGADYTFLDKGFRAQIAGDHIEAVRYFQSYNRLESSAVAAWESGIAIAYDSMLPQSPIYSPQAAAKSYLRLEKQKPTGVQFHEKVLMMQSSLATLATMTQQNLDLERRNSMLAEDLKKREEALKRLRELTLGQ
ncbi:MAG: hypothetical protein ACI9JM_000696 [Halioglobus sp.]|jgi:hypothetical protein